MTTRAAIHSQQFSDFPRIRACNDDDYDATFIESDGTREKSDARRGWRLIAEGFALLSISRRGKTSADKMKVLSLSRAAQYARRDFNNFRALSRRNPPLDLKGIRKEEEEGRGKRSLNRNFIVCEASGIRWTRNENSRAKTSIEFSIVSRCTSKGYTTMKSFFYKALSQVYSQGVTYNNWVIISFI